MGEYAIRKSDRLEVKIGTCENMYYMTFDDRDELTYIPNSVNLDKDRDCNGLRFRVPFLDEVEVPVGEYADFRRAEPLISRAEHFGLIFEMNDAADDPGTIHLEHESTGFRFSLPCFHGEKPMQLTGLNKDTAARKYGLSFVKAIWTGDRLELCPVVRCEHCGREWRCCWEKVLAHVDPILAITLKRYAAMSPNYATYEAMERYEAGLQPA